MRSWKRNVRLVVVHHFDPKGQLKTVNLYACTDTDIPDPEVLHRYECRFQIEFLYRDAKQHVGLTHCQARSANKLHFHPNTALTAVSLAKAAHHLDKPAQERSPSSMAGIKTRYANKLLLDHFLHRLAATYLWKKLRPSANGSAKSAELLPEPPRTIVRTYQKIFFGTRPRCKNCQVARAQCRQVKGLRPFKG